MTVRPLHERALEARRARLWVITHGTKDYGEKFVVRVHVGGLPAREPIGVCATLEEARHVVEVSHSYSYGLVRLERVAADDPVIVETWASKATVAIIRKALTRRKKDGPG